MFILLGCTSNIDEEFVISDPTLGIELSIVIKETSALRKDKSIIYITDGQEFLNQGIDPYLIDLTKRKELPGAYYVYVSSINEKSGSNERNRLFFCNESYLKFFTQSIIPQVESIIGSRFSAKDRSLIGVSFGGLNAAYFAAKSDDFKNYALLSPITYPCRDVHTSIAFSESSDLRIFISTGLHDAENYTAPLAEMFRSKGYEVRYHSTKGNHDFQNWKQQMPAVINFLTDND